jgi:hypothetical protein
MCELEPEVTGLNYRLHDPLCPMTTEECLPATEQQGNVLVITKQNHTHDDDGCCYYCGVECWCVLIGYVRQDERNKIEKDSDFRSSGDSDFRSTHERSTTNMSVTYSSGHSTWQVINKEFES